jgi:RNA polymerase sigma factor (sigma-70 family)
MKYTLTNQEANKIVKDHKGLLVNFVHKNRYKLYNYEEVYSIALEALLKAAEKLNTKLATMGHFSNICMGRALKDAQDVHNNYTSRKSFTKNEGTLIINSIKSDQAKLDLEIILNILPERHKNIIVLRHIYGYELKEIAKELGITYQRVQQIESFAMKQLISKWRKH